MQEDTARLLDDLRERTDAAQRQLALRGAKKMGGLSRGEREALEHLNRARQALGLARANLLERSD